jgi:hypothetical protein
MKTIRLLLALLFFAQPLSAGDWVNLRVEEWRISSSAPRWLRQAALRSSILWCRADKTLCRPFKTTPDSLANIIVGPTIEDFAGMTLLSPDWRPLLVVNEDEVGYLATHRNEAFALLMHEMGHALCGCDDHHVGLYTGVMSPELGKTPHTPNRADVALLRRGMR